MALHTTCGALFFTGYTARFAASPQDILATFGPVLGSVLIAGYFGVWIFFLLSGYLLGRPFVMAIVHGHPAPSVRRYAIGRVLRILPAYWAVVVFIVIVPVWLMGAASPSPTQVLEILRFQYPADNEASRWIAQGWTLRVEIEFYVALPIMAVVAGGVARIASTARGRALMLATPSVAYVLLAPFLVPGGLGTHSFGYFIRLFVAGIAIAALEPLIRSTVERTRRGVRGTTTIAVVALFCILAAAALIFRVGSPFDDALGDFVLNLAVIALVTAPLLRQWATGRSWKMLENRPVRWLGTRSYSFYLVHILVIYGLGRAFAEPGDGYRTTLAWLLPSTLVVTSLVAEALYRSVELPFLRRKRIAASGRLLHQEKPNEEPLQA